MEFQVDPPETCAVANASEVYGRPVAFGWSDTRCDNQFYPMCRVNSERPSGSWACLAAAAAGLRLPWPVRVIDTHTPRATPSCSSQC